MRDLAAPELETPALALDRARLEANAERMRARVAQHAGVRLRPHLKTAKSSEVAELALGSAAFRGLTVATLDEAAYFAARGYTDLRYAVGLVPGKVARVAELARAGAHVSVVLDDADNARCVGDEAARHGIVLDVLLEVDAGQGRGGRPADDPRLLEAARALDAHPATRLLGVLTHAGHSYDAPSLAALRAIAEAERAAAVEAATRIRGLSIACEEVSVGSTPTALFAERLDGVTEVRAGVYVFFDRFQAALGVCAPEERALSVIATVIARRAEAAWIDAGTLALSSERSLERFGDRSYGEVTALDGAALRGAPRVDALNQEHGRVVASEGSLGSALYVGERVRVWPNHACITAAMFDRYHVIEEGAALTTWPRLRG